MPCRMASAWEFTPPPYTLASTRKLLRLLLMLRAFLIVSCHGSQLKYSSIGLLLTIIELESPLKIFTLATDVFLFPVP